MKRRKRVGVLLGALSAACFGVMPVFARMAYDGGVSTYSLLFLRFLAGAAFMFLLARGRRLPMPSPRQALVCLALGALPYVGTSLCYFTALRYSTAATVTLLVDLNPAMVLLGAALFLHARITARKVLALCLALGGASIIIGTQLQGSFLGIVLALGAAAFYAAYTLISSVAVQPGMGIQSSGFIMLGAAAVYGVVSLLTGFTPPVGGRPLAAVVLLALISTVVAFWAFFAGMERTDATTVALASSLEPVVGVTSSVVLLSEPLTWGIVIGGCMVLAALAVTATAPPETQ